MGSYTVWLSYGSFFSDFIFVIIPWKVVTFVWLLLGVDTVCPVICCNLFISIHEITINKECSPYSFEGFKIRSIIIIFCIDTNFSNTVFYFIGCFCRCRAWFVVVVYDIYVLCFATIASFTCPIVEYIITDVYFFIQFQCGRTRAKAWNTAFTMGNHIVMVSSETTTPVSTKSMCFYFIAFLLTGNDT